MRLVDVRTVKTAYAVLYNLLAERPSENFISHERMPTADEHFAFVAHFPFRYWYLLLVDEDYVGALECTDRNEIGITLFRKHQRKGYGTQALALFRSAHEPLPAIQAVRNGHWLANVAPMNIGSKLFFARCGFRMVQETWVAQ